MSTLNIPPGIDFLDFGSSRGGSLRATSKKFSCQGMGIDIDDEKIAEATALGFNVVKYDVVKGGIPKNSVSFVTMYHVIEHLESYNYARRFLSKGIYAARDFVAIRVPYFDIDGFLLSNGYKFYHSDWTGHKFPLSSLQLFRMIRDLQKSIIDFKIYGRQRLKGSTNYIVPITSPTNTSKIKAESYKVNYDLNKIEFPVYKELCAIIMISNKFKFDELEKMMKIISEDVIYSKS